MIDASPSQGDQPANGLEWFGRELAAALLHRGASQRQLADFTGYKEPYVSKAKNGKAMPSPAFAEGCDRFFNTSGSFSRLLAWISEGGHPGWFIPYINLEKQASRIEDYSNALIMGMLNRSGIGGGSMRWLQPPVGAGVERSSWSRARG
ncbi:helix-turn-helix domain-containing protein, partial [Streptomyces albidoflavus]|uniref:helix-turn-helix domain-containing protein n=1 Tax=Streptomyces albidoflavus TaxID=1886 RepID=UPI00331D9970